jgi:prepilin-type N-terminal cleavage/methylation domain-containing protein
MKMEFQMTNSECRISGGNLAADASWSKIRHPPSAIRHSNGFTLVEVMVVVVLLSVIVLALMAVFNSTQTAFRAGVTDAGVLESGRAAMDLMTGDLRAMSPSFGRSNNFGGANFYAVVTNYASPPSPLYQPMVGGGSTRTNVLENFYILSRGNANGVPTWYAVGYAVATNAPPGPLYSLYRFSTNYPVAAFDPALLVVAYFNFLTNITSGSHLMDGVVALTVRAYDVHGGQMTTNVIYSGGQIATNKNVFYFPPAWGQVGFIMFSNTLPASVEIEMGVLEDRALQRAGSLSGNFLAQSNYLSGGAGQVHVFRQRVSIPNVDPSAYQ